MWCVGIAVYECVYMRLCVCTSNQCGDGGKVSSVRTAVNTAGFLEGLGRTVLKGPGDGGTGTEGSLLVPQDGVLVVKLQLLHRGTTTCLLSTTVPVSHHLKGLLHFSVLACLHMLGGGHQRGELCVTEDLRGSLGGSSPVGGQPSPWRAIYTGRL